MTNNAKQSPTPSCDHWCPSCPRLLECDLAYSRWTDDESIEALLYEYRCMQLERLVDQSNESSVQRACELLAEDGHDYLPPLTGGPSPRAADQAAQQLAGSLRSLIKALCSLSGHAAVQPNKKES
jgi:hypothetical protein